MDLNFLDFCWDIKKGWLAKEFQNWGNSFSVEFDIQVTKLSSGDWQNVFHFTASNQEFGENHGDRIPALWINKAGFFLIVSSLNDNGNYYTNVDFQLGKTYQFTIQQIKKDGKYWYEIIIDGNSTLKLENNNPLNFSSVYLYASDPWFESFTSEFGSICNIKIRFGGKYALTEYNFDSVSI